MDFNQLADGVVKKYLSHGYTAARVSFEDICARRNIYGWSKLFLLSRVKVRLNRQNHAAYLDFIADSKGIDKKKGKR